MRLYGYWRSTCSWRVRIVLETKGVDWTYEPVHLVRDGGEQHLEGYRGKNPLRQVPTLEVEEGGARRYLTQSLAICEYLEERFPEPRMLPADAFQRAKVRQLAEVVNAGIQPLQNLGVMQHLLSLHPEADKLAWAREWIRRGFDALEPLTAEVAGRFSVGDRVSLADAFLVPQLYNARRFGLPLDDYPTLLRVETACAELPAFQKAHPDQQSDAQN